MHILLLVFFQSATMISDHLTQWVGIIQTSKKMVFWEIMKVPKELFRLGILFFLEKYFSLFCWSNLKVFFQCYKISQLTVLNKKLLIMNSFRIRAVRKWTNEGRKIRLPFDCKKKWYRYIADLCRFFDVTTLGRQLLSRHLDALLLQ